MRTIKLASLTILILLGMFLAAAVSTGCNQVKDGARAAAADLVDCTIATGKAHADEYGALLEAALRAAVNPDGSVDWTAIGGAAKRFGVATGGCALAAAVARLLAPPVGPTAETLVAPALTSSSGGIRAGFEALRAELWPGVRFQTDAGVL